MMRMPMFRGYWYRRSVVVFREGRMRTDIDEKRKESDRNELGSGYVMNAVISWKG